MVMISFFLVRRALQTLELFLNLRYNFRMERFMSMFKETHTQAHSPGVTFVELGPLLMKDFDPSASIG